MATLINDESQVELVLDLGLVPEPIIIGKGAKFLVTNHDIAQVTNGNVIVP